MNNNLSVKNNESNNTIFGQYKIARNDFDINNIDPDCMFTGDVYIVKYKSNYDWFAPFEEQTYKKLVQKNAKLLRIGFDTYINISKINSSSDIEKIKRKLNDNIKKKEVIISGEFFKPYADEYITMNVKPYSQIVEVDKTNHSLIKKIMIRKKQN